jgi:hypothetical protein
VVAGSLVTIVAPTGATVVGTIAFPTGSPQFTVRLKGLAILPTPPFINDGGVESIGSLHLEDTTCRGLRVPSNPVRRSVYIRNCLIDFGALPHELWNVDAVLLDSTVYGSYCSQGLHVQGTLRAERSTMTTGGCAYGPTAGLSMDRQATAAGCTFVGAPSSIYGGGYYNVYNQPPNAMTTSAGVGSSLHPVVVRPLATAAWATQQWFPGGNSVVTYRLRPNLVVASVIALDLVPWQSPLFGEPLWVGATSAWAVWSFGVSDAQGSFTTPVPIPNLPALLDTSAWLTGVFLDQPKLQTTAPLGGMLR